MPAFTCFTFGPVDIHYECSDTFGKQRNLQLGLSVDLSWINLVLLNLSLIFMVTTVTPANEIYKAFTSSHHVSSGIYLLAILNCFMNSIMLYALMTFNTCVRRTAISVHQEQEIDAR